MLNETQKVDNKNTQSDELLNTQPSFPLWKRIVLFFTSMFFMFIFPLIAYFMILGVPKEQKDMALNYICYGVMALAMFLIIFIDIPKFKKIFKDYTNYLGGLGMGIALIVLSIAYLNLVKLHPAYTISQNEEGVRSTLTFYPALSIIFIGILAPITEELAHRVGVFKSLCKVNKILAYAVSSLIFAFLHFGWTNPNMIAEWLNFPLYFASGLLLAFTYDQFSVVGSSLAHITNNLYSVIITLYFVGFIHA